MVLTFSLSSEKPQPPGGGREYYLVLGEGVLLSLRFATHGSVFGPTCARAFKGVSWH